MMAREYTATGRQGRYLTAKRRALAVELGARYIIDTRYELEAARLPA